MKLSNERAKALEFEHQVLNDRCQTMIRIYGFNPEIEAMKKKLYILQHEIRQLSVDN